MNLQENSLYFEQAVDTVVTALNLAKHRLGARQNLAELAESRKDFLPKVHVSLAGLKVPLVKSCEELLKTTIEKTWSLTRIFKYTLRFIGTERDEISHFWYFEAIFSQPTASYPIPQAMVSVLFKAEGKHIYPLGVEKAPLMTFKVEGQHAEHDIRYVLLTEDWLLAILKMKINLFSRIEALKLF